MSRHRSHHFRESRAELMRTLRLHEMGTTATLAITWCISIVFVYGLVAAVSESLKSRDGLGGPGATELAMVGICVLAWIACCHYLWRCYRGGLQDVRNLYRQLTHLDRMGSVTKQNLIADDAAETEDAVDESHDARGEVSAPPAEPEVSAPARSRRSRREARAREARLAVGGEAANTPGTSSGSSVVHLDNYRH